MKTRETQQGPEAVLCAGGSQGCVNWNGAYLCGLSYAAGEALLCIVAAKPTFFRLDLQRLKDTASSRVLPKAGTSRAMLITSEGRDKTVVEASLANIWQLLTCICENTSLSQSDSGREKGILE